ncbi:MAG TPA: undecaprenyl-diphosphatase UppP [Anaerolineales bacterium]
MTTIQAVLLGIIQGLTEFIPVSSTAHLLIAQQFMGIKATQATFAFSVLVQVGTLVSLLVFYWKDLLQIARAMIRGLLERRPFDAPQARLGWLVGLATLPALVVGFLLRDAIKGLFQEPLLEAGIRLVVTSLLLVLAELALKGARTLEGADWKDALVAGTFQILAVFPGASRSGATITGGMMRGLSRPEAARFAFLMSIPLMLAVGVYQTRAAILLPGTHKLLPELVTGFITAAVVGWLAIRWLIHYLNRNSLYLMALYTAIVGLICLAFYFVV